MAALQLKDCYFDGILINYLSSIIKYNIKFILINS